MYPEQLVAPMRAELVDAGVKELKTADEVTEVLGQQAGTVLLIVNSVCGCAAGTARPGARLALKHSKQPDKVVTVFAGMEKEAVNKARQFMLPYPPSSPSMALFKDGKLVHMIERHLIEGRSAEMIADNLIGAFESYC